MIQSIPHPYVVTLLKAVYKQFYLPISKEQLAFNKNEIPVRSNVHYFSSVFSVLSFHKNSRSTKKGIAFLMLWESILLGLAITFFMNKRT